MHWVERREALAHCQILEESDYRLLLIEAQAGQGKTVLASQYAHLTRTPSDWLLCDSQHCDAILFLDALLVTLKKNNPDFDDAAVRQTAYKSPLGPETLPIVLDRLQHELSLVEIKPCQLIVDDAHLLSEAPLALTLLGKLPEILGESTTLLCISRYPLMLEEERVFPLSKALVIDGDLLAFSREEVAELYNEVLGVSVCTEDIQTIRDITDGWAAGLVMLSQNDGDYTNTPAIDSSEFMQYFSLQLLDSVPDDLREELQLASLLAEIPIDFARQFSERNLIDWLEELRGKNYFIKMTGSNEASAYRLHHLFQDALQKSAQTAITQGRKQKFLSQAATWFEEHGHIERALHYIVEAEDWVETDSILGRHGAQLIGQARYQTLLQSLANVPEKDITDSAWICFIIGWTSLHLAPEESLHRITRAWEVFNKTEQPIGEMMALSLLITYLVVADRNFARKKWTVDRLSELYEQFSTHLPAPLLAFCTHSLIVGYCYFLSDFKSANNILPLLDIQEGTGVDSCYGIAVLAAFQGNLRGAHDRLERFFPSVNAKWSSPMECMAGKILKSNFLHMGGDFVNFLLLKQDIENTSHGLALSTHLGLFLKIWDLDYRVGQGQTEEALNLANQILSHPAINGNHHLTSQVTQYQSFCHALSGRHDEALSTGLTALQSRACAGGFYFRVFGQLVVGAGLLLGPHAKRGERLLLVAIKRCKQMEETLLSPVAHGYLAAFYLRSGNEDLALAHIRSMGDLLHVHENKSGFGWNNEVLLPVLKAAVKNNINPSLFSKLARDKNNQVLFEDGTASPLLQIRLCGHTAIYYGTPENSVELSPMMQKLIERLCTSPNLQMKIGDIITQLWPDDLEKNGRNSLDRLLSRLRGNIRSALGPNAAKCHIVLKGGELGIEHCKVDCLEALNFGQNGIQLAKDEKNWQAHNAFEVMEHHLVRIKDVPSYYEQGILEASSCWVEVLRLGNMNEKALLVAESALELEPLHDSLQKNRYESLRSLNLTAKAILAKQEYKASLKTEGFLTDEIDRILAAW